MYSDEQIIRFVEHTAGNQLKDLPHEVLIDDRFLNRLDAAQFISLARAEYEYLRGDEAEAIKKAFKRRALTEPFFQQLIDNRDTLPEPVRYFFYL